MEKFTLKLGDILQLGYEINGLIVPETNERIYEGFLNQNLSIILKYELTDVGEMLQKEKKKIDGLRDELIKKYGEVYGENLAVKMYLEETDEEGNINKQINPKYIEFDNEYNQLLNQEKEIEFPEVTLKDLKDAGKTKDVYKVLFKLIKKEGTN